MPTNADKRLPLNLDLEKLLAHYDRVPDTGAYEARQARAKQWRETHAEELATAKKKWQRTHPESRLLRAT